MKKLFLIIIVLFTLTGCYDNIELDDLAIIGAVGIDYIDDNFYVTYEIYNSNKDENSSNLLSYTVSGSGKTISDAFIDTNYKTGKKPYYSHFKIMLVSESIINGHLDKIIDYLFRDIEIRDEFQLIVTNSISPEEILKMNSTKHPVVADLINDLLNLEKHNNNLATNETFKEIVSKLVSKKQDIILNSIGIKDERISLLNSYIFKEYEYKNNLDELDTTIYNMLNKNVTNVHFDRDYPNGFVSININSSKTDINVDNNKIIINSKLEGRIIENNPAYDLKNSNTYTMLNNDFSDLIKEKINNFLKYLQINNTDILGIQNKYYKKNNKEIDNLWTTFDIEVKVDLKLNTKGFIFEVKNGE